MSRRMDILVTIFICLCICGSGLADGLLQSLPDIKDYHAKRVSSYDRNGGNRDYLSISTGTVTLAEIEGPGAITHIWSTINTRDPNHLRNLVLRIYWDGEKYPSVEAPVGDFFGLGHCTYYHYHSRPISIGTNKGLNCFWYMPFKKSAKITVTNESDIAVGAYYYYIDYQSFEKSPAEVDSYFDEAGYFHAQYNQAMCPEKGQYFRILEASGKRALRRL
jgi:D-arabinan exo alpha-(1,3)/(1,5)-arabinofuranosidase (non-reducing end)